MNEMISEPISVMPVARRDGTFALRLCVNQGLLTPNMVRRLLSVMETFDLPSLRATTGQRMNLEGIPKDRLDEVVAALGTAVPKCPPGISVCPGGGICKYGMQETRVLGDRLLALIKANAPYPFKLKSGVSGCKMSCALSYVRDIGLTGKARGWEVRFGGSAMAKASAGVLLAENAEAEEALALIENALKFYRENGKKRERTGTFVRRVGEDALLKAVKQA